jgi:signal-transduction protein with cAMP-binding, CBS, and nucleotidyltransferase domain
MDVTLFADFKPQGQDCLLEWCTQRGYIDTANLFPLATLAVRSVKGCLENVPMFASWSREAIACLANLCQPLLFEEDKVILEEGESCLEMCLLISGRVVFTADDQIWRSVDAGPQGYWFGEEGLFLNETRRCSVKTDIPSQIVVIDRNQVNHVLQQFPNERNDYNRLQHHWEQKRQRLDYSLCHKHKGLLDIEIVTERLLEAADLNGCSRMAAYKIAMEMSVKAGNPGDILLSSQDIGTNAFLVVLGVIELVEDSKVVKTLSAGEYYRHDQLPTTSNQLMAQVADMTVTALFPFPAIAEALQSHEND